MAKRRTVYLFKLKLFIYALHKIAIEEDIPVRGRELSPRLCSTPREIRKGGGAKEEERKKLHINSGCNIWMFNYFKP
ncbi:hypothetical protein POVWA2_039500 [Plasmodium ovale wallikeri]|uniref:Uncharacterized protein n=1 Tax=Plasmodium ovale wallikeri TaxID=864142 RepID=A0A1A8Z7U4_PLAOA|nr:hypothetical protein POVWA1_040930 [Plasmodium ovale wallikeri]SBT40310.1 hypothetical protein POVWA2_039500 [Plasmodium ovale wallikeri]